MIKRLLYIPFLLFSFLLPAQITLTHNIGTTPIQTDMSSCEFAQSWARAFKLEDFGVSGKNKLVINSGQVAIYNSLGGSSLQFNIYKIDSNFPNTYSNTNLIGSSQIVGIPVIGANPEIIQVDFDVPVVIPDGVERVLVEVRKFYDVNKQDTSVAYIAGTAYDNDVSWYWGCHNVYSHTATENLNPPSYNANFYINVTGTLLNINDLGSDIMLTHNLCDDVVKVNQYSCSWGGLKYARRFILKEFGVSANEEFIIDRGQVALSSVGVYDAKIQFNIYKIDDNFPASYSQTDLLGSSQVIYLPGFSTGGPRIFEVLFGTPITVPANVDKILVEVYNLGSSSSAGLVFIAGGAQNNDISWLRSEAGGCPPFQQYTATTNPNINYFINVTGKTKHVTNNFEMNVSNICSEFLKEFSVENKANVALVSWDFGDVASGAANFSTDLSPFHDFSQDGEYTITANVTAKDGSIEVLKETIDVKEPPQAYGINNIYACEDNYGTGISSSFDVSAIHSQVLNGRTDVVVTYLDGSGRKMASPMPNTLTNSIKNRETISVRVAYKDEPCCYSETTFDLIVNALPKTKEVTDVIICDDDFDGIGLFNFQKIKDEIIGVETDINVRFYHQNGKEILSDLTSVSNMIANEELIKVIVKNSNTECFSETTFKLRVLSLPMANTLQELVGCDDNNDGISEYFDTSNIQSQVLGNQIGMEVSYFKSDGSPLPNPLPNPFTNTVSNQEIITVRVTNSLTKCFSETTLVLKTASKPQISKPETIYACNDGEGYGLFNMSLVESQLIGNQNGLKIQYFDANNNQLPNPLPFEYKNTTAWFQTIFVKVENEFNSLCYSQTSFDLVVNELPLVTIENAYFLCNLEPSMHLIVEDYLDYYAWEYQDGTVISNSYEVNLVEAGNYKLTVGEIKNGIYCENSFHFKLIRSELPDIVNVDFQELSDANFITVNATGDGDFEYSIDGISFQNSNTFKDVLGGVYTVLVRDKLGCGEDFEKVTVIDYPKYFTPNNDGVNDTWHIRGIAEYPSAEIFIYDRYGKLLKQLSTNSLGWDGTFRGEKMISTDYWFIVKLNNESEFKGHFALKK
ncbi:T9SS type B sorting domain-containing protein [Mariniflexile sp.]|uniref:T9SS type B sorting domain-containing protein n=1 Tax=Mariniflexile sp. TaxID=1979402 RepID=UPI003565A84D